MFIMVESLICEKRKNILYCYNLLINIIFFIKKYLSYLNNILRNFNNDRLS